MRLPEKPPEATKKRTSVRACRLIQPFCLQDRTQRKGTHKLKATKGIGGRRMRIGIGKEALGMISLGRTAMQERARLTGGPMTGSGLVVKPHTPAEVEDARAARARERARNLRTLPRCGTCLQAPTPTERADSTNGRWGTFESMSAKLLTLAWIRLRLLHPAPWCERLRKSSAVLRLRVTLGRVQARCVLRRCSRKRHPCNLLQQEAHSHRRHPSNAQKRAEVEGKMARARGRARRVRRARRGIEMTDVNETARMPEPLTEMRSEVTAMMSAKAVVKMVRNWRKLTGQKILAVSR
mmetsp:Transcript_18197/g.42338  ORF Transcript_18197/g.42338 Transcript_18197/m.42338 type:complete len:295 (-) Transcript_18197:1161-2045(-)